MKRSDLILLLTALLVSGCQHIPQVDIPGAVSNAVVEAVTPTTTTTTTTTQPAVDEPEEASYAPNATPLYAVRYDTVDAMLTVLKQSKTGHWNSDNSRDLGKLVLQGKYAGQIAWVAIWGDGYWEQMKRAYGDESGHRQRYYTSKKIADLPYSVTIRVHLVADGAAQDIYFEVANTAVDHRGGLFARMVNGDSGE